MVLNYEFNNKKEDALERNYLMHVETHTYVSLRMSSLWAKWPETVEEASSFVGANAKLVTNVVLLQQTCLLLHSKVKLLYLLNSSNIIGLIFSPSFFCKSILWPLNLIQLQSIETCRWKML